MATQLTGQAAEALEGLEAEATKAPRFSPMTRYYLRRLGLYLITLWGSLTASFFFFRLLPGDPISGIITQLQTRGVYTNLTQSADMEKFYRKEFGLDGNLWDQYVNYFKRVLLEFNFGPSVLSYPTPATDLITRSIPWTIALLGSATLIAWVFGILIGTLIGWKRGHWLSRWVTNFCLITSNIPAYFIALILIIFFAYRWQLLPASGAYSASLQPGWNLTFIGSAIKYGTLPVLATAITGAAGWIIGTRALIQTLLGEDFLTYANAKGLSPRRILLRYVLRNAWLPQIAALGISLGFVVNGNVLIERLFRYPGVGNLLVDSVVIKDVNTAMAVVTVLIFMVLTINLIIDLILPIFDPRVKYGD